MREVIVEKKVKTGIGLGWFFQLVASLSWITSVIVYGSYELGDCLQLLAASAWTVSNIMTYITHINISFDKDRANE